MDLLIDVDTRCWILDAGYWMLDAGHYWMKITKKHKAEGTGHKVIENYG